MIQQTSLLAWRKVEKRKRFDTLKEAIEWSKDKGDFEL